MDTSEKVLVINEAGQCAVRTVTETPVSGVEVGRLLGNLTHGVDVLLKNVIRDGVLLIKGETTRGAVAVEEAAVFVKLRDLPIFSAFVTVAREGEPVIVPQWMRNPYGDTNGAPVPQGEDKSLMWTPPAGFGLFFGWRQECVFIVLAHYESRRLFHLPFGNCFNDGHLCTGEDVAQQISRATSLEEKLLIAVKGLYTAKWTQDLAYPNQEDILMRLFAFTEGGEQLPYLPDGSQTLVERLSDPTEHSFKVSFAGVMNQAFDYLLANPSWKGR